MNCTLYKKAGGKALRTSIVKGELLEYPRLNAALCLTAAPLEEGSMRLIETSHVIECHYLPDNQGLLLTTETGSQYLLERSDK